MLQMDFKRLPWKEWSPLLSHSALFTPGNHFYQQKPAVPSTVMGESPTVLFFSRSVISDSFVTPWTVACQAPLSMRFPGQEYWSGLPFPSPGDLPYPGIEPGSPVLAGGFLTTEPPGTPPSFLPTDEHMVQYGQNLSALLPTAVISPVGGGHMTMPGPSESFLELLNWKIDER